MKNGTASSEKLSTPETIFWQATKVPRSSGRFAMTVTMEEIIRLMDTGTLSASIRKKLPSSSKPICNTLIVVLLSYFCSAAAGSAALPLISLRSSMMKIRE